MLYILVHLLVRGCISDRSKAAVFFSESTATGETEIPSTGLNLPHSQLRLRMILNSLSDANSSFCPSAFQEVNGLTIVVPNEEESGTLTSDRQSFPQTPPPFDTDCQSDDILLRALQSPLPALGRTTFEPVTPNEVLSYLNFACGDCDSGTFSKLTTESSSSNELISSKTQSCASEQNAIAYSDLNVQEKGKLTVHGPKVCSKRKASSSKSVSKRGKVTQPSKFCHVCVRSGEQVTLAPCANVIGSLCRKAICQKCFDKHGIRQEWTSACENREIIRQIHAGIRDRLPDNVWTCLHCRQSCPQSAQCKIYARTNKRRHMILKQRKAEKDQIVKRHLERGLEMPRPHPSDILTGRQTLVSETSIVDTRITSPFPSNLDVSIAQQIFATGALTTGENISRMMPPSSTVGIPQMHPYFNLRRQ